MRSLSSPSSKTLTSSCGMNSLKPSMNAVYCPWIRLVVRYSTINLVRKPINTQFIIITHTEHPDSLDKLLFVLLRDWDIQSTRFQLDRHKLSKLLFLEGERLVNDIRNVILQYPFHTPMECGIDALKIAERNLL